MKATRQRPKVVTSNRGHTETTKQNNKMKHVYTICKGWNKPTQDNILQTETNKATAKREAKEWAAATRSDIVVYCDGEFLGVMEFPVYMRNCKYSDTSLVTVNF